MLSDLDSRDDDEDRGPIPLDIDNVHLLLQGASFFLTMTSHSYEGGKLYKENEINTLKRLISPPSVFGGRTLPSIIKFFFSCM